MRAEFVRTVAAAAGVVTPREASEVSRTQQESNRASAAMESARDPEQRRSVVNAIKQSEDRVRLAQQAQLNRRQQDVMRASATIARQSMNQTRDAVKVLASINSPVGGSLPVASLGSFIDRYA